MTTAFPNIKPSSRDIQPGQFPVKRFTTIAGTGFTRLYGSQPFNASIDLAFQNIGDAAVQSILDAFEAAYGATDDLALPELLWDGVSDRLRERLERDYLWRFAQQAPPQVRSVRRGISTVSVRLEGHRDG